MDVKKLFHNELDGCRECGDIIEEPSEKVLGVLEEYLELSKEHGDEPTKEGLYWICHFIHYSALGSAKGLKY